MDNRAIIRILFFILLAALLSFGTVIYFYWRRLKEKTRDAVFIGKPVKVKYLYAFYQFATQFFLTRHYIRRLRRKYEVIHPRNPEKIGEATIKTAVRVWILAAVLIILAFLFGMSLYMFFVTITLIYLMNSYITFRSVHKAERKLLLQFERFLGILRHSYYQTGRVDDAIYETLNDLDEPMSIHAEMMYEILISPDVDEAADKYNEIVPNRFLKTFLSLCILITRFGDRTVEGQSLFLQNLTYLKEEINIELRKREKIEHKFQGLVFITVIPMYFLKIVEGWAIANVPGLYAYYHGAYGMIVSVLICAVSLIIYNLIIFMSDYGEMQIKDYVILDKIAGLPAVSQVLDGYINRRYSKTLKINDTLRRMGESITVKQFLLKRFLYAAGTVVAGMLFVTAIHYTNRYNSIHYTENLVNVSSAATEKEIENIREVVEWYSNMYKDSKTITEPELVEDMIEKGVVKSKQLMIISAGEVLKRIERYQKEYMKWYEVLLILILALMAYYLPFWMLLYKQNIMRMNMEDEVIQFQSIILMLMHIERISANDILSWMEQFSVFFKASIEECLNNYSFGEMEALEELKNKEPFEPFQRLVDDLIMCDRIGMKAFNEVMVERKNFQEKRKLENEILIDNRASIGEFLSFIPLFMTVGLYLIVPFLIEGMNQFSLYLSQLEI